MGTTRSAAECGKSVDMESRMRNVATSIPNIIASRIWDGMRNTDEHYKKGEWLPFDLTMGDMSSYDEIMYGAFISSIRKTAEEITQGWGRDEIKWLVDFISRTRVAAEIIFSIRSESSSLLNFEYGKKVEANFGEKIVSSAFFFLVRELQKLSETEKSDTEVRSNTLTRTLRLLSGGKRN